VKRSPQGVAEQASLSTALLEHNTDEPIIFDSQNSSEHFALLLRLAMYTDPNNLPVLKHMVDAGIRFEEHTFKSVFLGSRRTGRTSIRLLRVVFRCLLLKPGQRRLFLMLDHRPRWACHCLLAELTEGAMGRFSQLRVRRLGPLLMVTMLDNQLPEAGGEAG
jgi:hypothetical protein